MSVVRRTTRRLVGRGFLPSLLVACLAASAVAVPAVAVPDEAAAQGIVALPRCGPRQDCAVVMPVPMRASVVRTGTRVSARLGRAVVHYEVTETFVNRGAGLGEADYLFPLPSGAAFEDLRLSINGELVAGEVLDAGRARAVYEEIVRRQRDPALVEWMGRGLVRARIFPIVPGEEKRVVLRYTQPAQREGDALRLDWRPARAPGGDAAPPAPTTIALRWDEGDGFGTPWSPTHDLRETAPRTREASVGGSDFTALVPVREPREAAITMLTHAPTGGDRWTMITFTPPAATVRRQPRDVTFVLDVSGSMSGRKLEQAKAAGRQVLGTLGAGDRLRIVAFSSDVREWREGFTPATRERLGDATAWLDGLVAGGGTNIAAALDAAYAVAASDEAVPVVLFVTDGEPTVGVTDPEAIAAAARSRRGSRRLFTFGLGADVNATLVERLAVEGRGTAQFVRPAESVERSVAITAQRLTAPLVTDLRVRAEGVRLVRLHPDGPQDVFAGQDLVVFAQVEGRGEATLVFSGRGATGPVEWREQVTVPEREPDNAFVGKLWATQRVGWLSAARRSGGASAETDTELRALGERWGIPTELTSYLVLEPGMAAGPSTASAARGRPTGAAASAKNQVFFESARRASEMRAAQSVAAVDAMAVGDDAGATTRQVGTRRFERRGRAWVPAGWRAGDARRVVTVQPYSAAWFALADAVPELKAVFALGDAVTAAGRQVVIVVAADGVTALPRAAIAQIVQEW